MTESNITNRAFVAALEGRAGLKLLVPRTTNMRIRIQPLILLVLLAVVSGCNKGDERVSSLRRQLLLADEPSGAASIADVRDGMTVDTQPDQDVLIVGRIGAGEFEPWADGQASFLMAEALPGSDHAATPGHDPANCPFCRRRAEKAGNATALVQFRDANGEVFPIDARKLLGVEKDQVVVVRGKGHVDKLGVLVVSATGIHVRR